MKAQYVLTGRWFQEPVDVRSAVEEQFKVIEVPHNAISPEEDEMEKYEDEPGNIAFVNEEWGGLVIFHNSWGESLHACGKLKAYVVTNHTAFADKDEIAEWEMKTAKDIDEWLIENTNAEPYEE